MLLLPLTLCQSCQSSLPLQCLPSVSPQEVPLAAPRPNFDNPVIQLTRPDIPRHPPRNWRQAAGSSGASGGGNGSETSWSWRPEIHRERMTWENVQMRWSWYHLMVISGMIDHNKQRKWYLQKSSWMVLVSSVCHREVCANVCNFGWSKHLRGRRSPLLAASRLLPQHQLQDLQNLDHCQRQGSEKVSTGIKGSSGKLAKDFRKGSTYGGTPYCWLNFTLRFRFNMGWKTSERSHPTWIYMAHERSKFRMCWNSSKRRSPQKSQPRWMVSISSDMLWRNRTQTLWNIYFKFRTPYIPGRMPGQLPQCWAIPWILLIPSGRLRSRGFPAITPTLKVQDKDYQNEVKQSSSCGRRSIPFQQARVVHHPRWSDKCGTRRCHPWGFGYHFAPNGVKMSWELEKWTYRYIMLDDI